MLRCPKCKCENIGQYRMMTGAIWCADCGYRVEHKEQGNPFCVPDVSDVAEMFSTVLEDEDGYAGIAKFYYNDSGELHLFGEKIHDPEELMKNMFYGIPETLVFNKGRAQIAHSNIVKTWKPSHMMLNNLVKEEFCYFIQNVKGACEIIIAYEFHCGDDDTREEHFEAKSMIEAVAKAFKRMKEIIREK